MAELLTIERVIKLKAVDIFSQTPEEDLVEVASIVEEVKVEKGENVIRKGEIGRSMYIIVKGEMRVHDEGKKLADLKENAVFGELAALDPEPRTATITALQDTELFRLEEGPLYDLMAEHVEVVRGIIRVLCRRMRSMISKSQEKDEEISELRKILDIHGISQPPSKESSE